MLARRPSDVLDNLLSRFLQWSGLLSHLRSYERYDEPETLPYSIHPVCAMSADGGQILASGGPLPWIRSVARSTFVGDCGIQYVEYIVAPRAYCKGYLKLSLVSCPIALYPATFEREKISFHQLHKQTGNRIKYRKVDAETGDEVESTDIIKGYQIGKSEYLELEPEELEAIAIESNLDRRVRSKKRNRRTVPQQPVLYCA